MVQIADQGIGVILMYSDAMFPNMESTQWMYSPQFAADRQDVGVKYMIGLLKGARDFNKAFTDGTDKADILNILIKYTSVKDPALYDKMQLSSLSANGSMDASNLQEQIDWLLEVRTGQEPHRGHQADRHHVHGSRRPGDRQGLTWTRSRSPGLTKVFAAREQRVIALDNVSLTIPRGQFVCIVGPSGCGKTTLLRIVAGLEQLSYGEVHVARDGSDTAQPSNSMIFQEQSLFPWMTVRDNVVVRTAHAPRAEARLVGDGRRLPEQSRPDAIRRRLSAPAVWRHEAAREHRARVRQRPGDSAHG